MITRRQIRAKVMQSIYACLLSGEKPENAYKMHLKSLEDELKDLEKKKNLSGDTRLLASLFYDSIENAELYDKYVMSKAENWELERIARIDRILMHMAICEMLNFQEIPIKVTINEYLELAKSFSTPQSSKFINGILDSLYAEFRKSGLIVKKGRGLMNETPNKKNISKNT